MTLPWEATKKLLRLQGIADELLNTARTSGAGADEALAVQVGAVVDEVRTLLGEQEPGLAGEFDRIVVQGVSADAPVDVRAAVLVGWLRAGLTAESLDEKRAAAAASQPPSPEQRRRKQTIGFKIRSPITREPEPDGK
ncbi:MAG: hypothetical protein ABR583_05585 [Gaiellaceae bacterium]